MSLHALCTEFLSELRAKYFRIYSEFYINLVLQFSYKNIKFMINIIIFGSTPINNIMTFT